MNTGGFFYASKTAGGWGNNLKVCTVDRGPTQSLYFLSTETLPTVPVGTIVTAGGGSIRGKVIDESTGSDGGKILHIIGVDGSDNYTLTPAQVFAGGADVTVLGNPYTLKSGADGVDDGSKWYLTKELYPGSNLLWNSVAARPVTTEDAEDFSTGGASAYDAVHVAIVDEDGGLTGSKNTILETFTYASKAYNARGPQGGSNYYKDVVSEASSYIYVGDIAYIHMHKKQQFLNLLEAKHML